MEEEIKRVIAEKAIIAERVEQYDKIKFYPVPEFKKDGQDIPCFKVKMASLDDQIKALNLSNHANRLTIRLLELFKDGKPIDYEGFRKQIYYDDLHPKTIQTCELFQRCVMEPSFTIEEVYRLSETHPDLVNNVASFALGALEEASNGNRKAS